MANIPPPSEFCYSHRGMKRNVQKNLGMHFSYDAANTKDNCSMSKRSRRFLNTYNICNRKIMDQSTASYGKRAKELQLKETITGGHIPSLC